MGGRARCADRGKASAPGAVQPLDPFRATRSARAASGFFLGMLRATEPIPPALAPKSTNRTPADHALAAERCALAQRRGLREALLENLSRKADAVLSHCRHGHTDGFHPREARRAEPVSITL